MVAVLGAASARALPGAGVAIRDIGFKMKNIELPSGMHIVIEEDHGQPLVAVVAVVDVGSAQDPVGKEGLAHLVEHLAFRAKPDGKVQRFSQLDFAGAGSWNAFTTHDLTTYWSIGPKEALAQLLALEGNRMLSPLAGLDEQAFDVERGVVMNEITQRDEQGEVSAIQAKLFGALYPQGHPYHRPVGGSEASISGLTLKDAESFVQEHYLPRNVTLYIGGDLDLATIERVLDASFPAQFLEAPPTGPIHPQRRMGDGPAPVPVPSASTRLETIHAPAERPMLYIAWSLPGGFGAQRYLERFTRSAFSGASVGAATRGSDIEALGTSLLEGRYGNTLVCRVLLKAGRDPEKSIDRVLNQIIALWEPNESDPNEVVEANREFGRLQKAAIVGAALQTESLTSRAVDKAVLIHWTGDPRAWGTDFRGLYELNSAKMQSFAYEWLTRDRARAIFVEPSGERFLPAEPTGTPGVFAAADAVRVKIAPEALSTYVHGPVSDVHTVVLKNGLELLLVRRASAPTVAVTLGFRGGYATSEPLGVSELASALAAPTQAYNGPPSKYGAFITLSPSADSTFYTGRAASGNLENVLAIMSDSVKSLHIDGGVTWYWKDIVNAHRRVDAQPSVQADRAFLQQLFPGSPLGRRSAAADIERLGPGDLQTWIDRTFHPRNAVMAVVGDIDLAETEKEVRDWFEGWKGDVEPGAEAKQSAATNEAEAPVRVVRVERPGVKQTELRLGCSLHTKSEADMIALRLLSAQLRGRLWNLARGSLGGSYGFSAAATFHRQASSLDIGGTVDDRALTRVLAVAHQQLDGLGTLKLTEDEVGLLKWRQGLASNVRYATNADLARGLVGMRLAGFGVDAIAKYPEMLAAVTADDISRVAAGCRKTAVLVVSGDPVVVAKALQSTGF